MNSYKNDYRKGEHVKKKQFFGLGVGLSSVIMIFVVLCLTTFAVLAYFCAKADGKFVDKKVEHQKQYLEADAKAEEYLAEIDYLLLNEVDADDIENAIKNSNNNLQYINNNDINCIHYDVNLSDDIKLHVVIAVNMKDGKVDKENRYSILEWRTVNSGYKLEEENLNLWDGKE